MDVFSEPALKWFVGNLALVDLLTASSYAFQLIYLIFKHQKHDRVSVDVCTLFDSINVFCFFWSSLANSLSCFNRYVCLCLPQYYKDFRHCGRLALSFSAVFVISSLPQWPRTSFLIQHVGKLLIKSRNIVCMLKTAFFICICGISTKGW